jgi:hypothetical protein
MVSLVLCDFGHRFLFIYLFPPGQFSEFINEGFGMFAAFAGADAPAVKLNDGYDVFGRYGHNQFFTGNGSQRRCYTIDNRRGSGYSIRVF